MEEIVVVMSPLDDYTTFEFESAPHLNETFMSQVGAIQYLLIIDYVSDSHLSVELNRL